ncbi:uncharacterized protein LOC115447023 isoform X2 [Manduca sexta]|uniref:uncharacterized protein LOC115447023 isoform X2 n=1 Tax=Manduca sexta TaxID=7130 RepID=UPI00188E6687|nr:uncharacterized protein LOC115447023 isoform X2 [Manduca sexta]
MCFNLAFLWTLVAASINIHRGGWLDRLVEYHKQNFYKELVEIAPLQIDASIQRAPPGYRDAKGWTVESVMHLLVLISESERARPVRIALRRMLRPTRRLSMSKQKSYKLFPSLSKNIENYLYYEVDTDEEYVDQDSGYSGIPDDEAVVVVSNPVEARLPSAQISVKLLRDILDARAQAARVMPSTTKRTIPWQVMNTTKTVADNATSPSGAADGATDGATGAVADSNTTPAVTAAPAA